MNEENSSDPHDGNQGNHGNTPAEATESLPTQASLPDSPPQGSPVGEPPQAGYGPAGGYSQPTPAEYGPGSPAGHGRPPQGTYGQPPYGQNPDAGNGQYAAAQQYGAGQPGQRQFGQGDYYNPVPPQYGAPGGQWNPPGGPPPAKKRFPVWGWILVLLAIAAITVGVLFATGVLGGEDEAEANPTPTQPVTPAPATPPSPNSTTPPVPVPTPTAPDPTTPPSTDPSPGSGSAINEGAVDIAYWTVEVVDFNPDANSILAEGFSAATPAAGNKFIGVQLQMTNNGSDPSDPYLDMFMSLTDDSLTELYSEKNTFDRDDTVISIGNVEPGQSGEGWVFFEVPEDFSSGALDIMDFSDSMNSVYLKVG
ncbi:DUF4352 domain-containing protein [Actinomycetaceae bacterium L2_0104]